MQRVSHNRESARCKYMQSEILIQDKTVTQLHEFYARSDHTGYNFLRSGQTTPLAR